MLKIGDEVISIAESNDIRYVVTAINEDDDDQYAILLSQNGLYGYHGFMCLKKTGRHFDEVEIILNRLKKR